MKFLSALALAALSVSSCARTIKPEPAPVAAPETERMTSTGAVVGYVSANGAHAWRAIPFAAAPTGNLRWRAPRPAQPWSGVREALTIGERCPQLSNGFHRAEGLEPGLVIGSEDCLTLDVYAPATARDRASLPVMVWIHGGGNVWGRSGSYDGSALAAHEQVIIVAVQYRMGPLGWFAHPAIRATAETAEDASANFGELDLIASLRWVRDNIAAFGGDASNVTIFGESAGGLNTVSLLASPLAAGLFHRAIVESGSFDSVSLDVAQGDASSADNSASAIASRLGADGVDALRAASTEDVYRALLVDGPGSYDVPNVIADGVALPETPMRDAFASTDTFNAVPVITGTNRDEMKLFQLLDDRLVKRVFGVFVVARDPALYDAASDYGSRLWRIRAVDEPANAMVAAGHEDVFAYRFDWDEGGRFFIMDTGKLLGASHAMEIPFVFHHFKLFGELDPLLFGRKTEASREDLATAIGGYWAEFARAGAPGDGGRGLVEWPRWADGALMRLDSKIAGGPEIIVQPDSIDALVADLRKDPRLDDETRCLVARGIGGWFADSGAEILRALECPPA